MKKNYLPPFLVMLLFAGSVFAQKEIPLPTPLPSDSSKWIQPERQYFSDSWKTEVVTNVSKPNLLVYLPKSERPTRLLPFFAASQHRKSIIRISLIRQTAKRGRQFQTEQV